MNKLVTLIAVVLTVNLFAAPAKKPVKKTPAAKSEVTETLNTEPKTEALAPATGDLVVPQVNPQPEPQPVAGQTSAATTAAPVAAADVITGTVDLRPSHVGDKGSFRSENYVDIGYKTGNSHFIFEQDFYTNLYNSGLGAGADEFQIRDAFFRFKQANLWESDDKTYSLSYELRPFLPTYAPRRDAGMITTVRNYAKFAAKVSDAVTVSLWEIPIAHIYNRAGYVNAAGDSVQNPGFENRVYLIADWSITDQWSLSFPLMINSARLREFNGKAAAWDNYVWIYPELDYALTNNYTIGLSWYNDRSFTAADLSETTISDGFKSGVTQLVFRATL